MEALVGEPSRLAPEIDFALGGRDFRGDIGSARADRRRAVQRLRARDLGGARSTSTSRAARTRRVPASSTSRPFELAAAGAAIVSNPYDGIERWFEPGRELLVVENADEAVDAYRELLADPGAGRGARPRARASACSTSTRTRTARGSCSS